jgi:hypothetical protein
MRPTGRSFVSVAENARKRCSGGYMKRRIVNLIWLAATPLLWVGLGFAAAVVLFRDTVTDDKAEWARDKNGERICR